MDKKTLSNYGWLVVVIIIIAILISTATPFASVIKGKFQNTVLSFKETGEGALDNMGAATNFGDISNGGSGGGGEGGSTEALQVQTPVLSLMGDVLSITDSSNTAESYDIYNGTTVIGTIQAADLETTYDLSGLEDGVYQIGVVGKCDGMSDSEMAVISYTKSSGTLIPVGGTYYVGVTTTVTGSYPDATETLIGDGSTVYFPETVQDDDIYVYGDYEYRYNKYADLSTWRQDLQQGGWGVDVLDNTKTTYGLILESVNGEVVNAVDCTFYSCGLLESFPDDFVIPSGAESAFYMFSNCHKLKSLPEGFTIPNGVKNVNKFFENCGKLTKLPDGFAIPDSVTNMSYMFSDCDALVSLPAGVKIPDGVKNLEGLFIRCGALQGLPEGFKIPNSVTTVSKMFYECSDLVALPDGFILPDTLTSVYQMFSDCGSLSELPDGFTIPNGVTTTSSMFSGCYSLSTLPGGFTIPNTVTNISYMFTYCTGLSSLPSSFVIPSSVTTMDSTFFLCEMLEGTIRVDANPTSYSICFKNTVQPIVITGSCSSETMANLAGTANNGNVSYR